VNYFKSPHFPRGIILKCAVADCTSRAEMAREVLNARGAFKPFQWWELPPRKFVTAGTPKTADWTFSG
jgi:hypothetical protein